MAAIKAAPQSTSRFWPSPGPGCSAWGARSAPLPLGTAIPPGHRPCPQHAAAAAGKVLTRASPSSHCEPRHGTDSSRHTGLPRAPSSWALGAPGDGHPQLRHPQRRGPARPGPSPACSCSRPRRRGSPCTPCPTSASPSPASPSARSGTASGSGAGSGGASTRSAPPVRPPLRPARGR